MQLENKNAIIKSAALQSNEAGVLTFWLQLDYGSSVQGFGGYALHLPKEYKHYSPTGSAGLCIARILEVAGVKDWKDLPGKPLRVEATFDKVLRIGHTINDDWFCPSEDLAPKPRPVERFGDVDVPQPIMEAAHVITEWAAMHGLKDWEIGGVADRSLLRRAVAEARSLRKDLEGVTKKEHPFPDKTRTVFESKGLCLDDLRAHPDMTMDAICSTLLTPLLNEACSQLPPGAKLVAHWLNVRNQVHNPDHKIGRLRLVVR